MEAGNIVAIAGLKEARTGDTLVGLKDAKTKDCRLKGIDCPEPVFTCSIEAASSADADALEEALGCVTREDPSVRVVHDSETGQLLLSGMGELHLEVVISRLRCVRFARTITAIAVYLVLIEDIKRPVAPRNLTASFHSNINSFCRCRSALCSTHFPRTCSPQIHYVNATHDSPGNNPF